MHSFSTEIDGVTYRAVWKLDGEDSIEVRSDYGNVWGQLAGRDPPTAARELLARIVPERSRSRRRV